MKQIVTTAGNVGARRKTRPDNRLVPRHTYRFPADETSFAGCAPAPRFFVRAVATDGAAPRARVLLPDMFFPRNEKKCGESAGISVKNASFAVDYPFFAAAYVRGGRSRARFAAALRERIHGVRPDGPPSVELKTIQQETETNDETSLSGRPRPGRRRLRERGGRPSLTEANEQHTEH